MAEHIRHIGRLLVTHLGTYRRATEPGPGLAGLGDQATPAAQGAERDRAGRQTIEVGRPSGPPRRRPRHAPASAPAAVPHATSVSTVCSIAVPAAM